MQFGGYGIPHPQFMSPGGHQQLVQQQQQFNFASPPPAAPAFAFAGQHVAVVGSPHVGAAPAPQDDFLHGSEKAVR
jgi:hypothetical protein